MKCALPSLLFVLSACSSVAVIPPPAVDAASDARPIDATILDDHPALPDRPVPLDDHPTAPDWPTPLDDHPALPDRPVPLACPITSTAPVAYHLRGEGLAYRDAGPASYLRQDLDLYLPQGRVAGAPILLAFPTYWPSNALTVVEGRFGADLGATGLDWTAMYGGVLSFRGRMAAPSGGLDLSLSGNLNGTTDTPEFAEGTLSLCPAGDAPAPTLRSDHAVTPRGAVDLIPSAPVAGDVSVVRLLVSGVVVPADASLHNGVLSVQARSWLPPGAPVAVDLGGLRDAMGRTFSLDGTIASLATSAVVTDREFTTSPPAGAVAADWSIGTTEGALRGGEGGRQPYRVLVALGPLEGATRLTAQFSFRCSSLDEFSVWVVAQGGSHVALPIGAATEVPDRGARVLQGALPGTGARWLLIENRSVRSQPGWGVPLSGCTFALDRITVE